MAGVYLPARLLDLCTACCNAVTGIEAYQGRKIWSETDSVEQIVRGLLPEEQGKMWLWVQMRQSQTYPWQPFTVNVQCELLLRLDTGKSSVCDLLYDKVEEVVEKLENTVTFTAVPAVPMGLSWEQVDDGSPEDGVARFKILAQYKVGPACEI
jgi:hypothetical protein